MKIMIIAIFIPLFLMAEPVPDLEYYWEQPQKISLGFSGGAVENAPAFGTEMLFPLGNFYLRPAIYLTAKDDEKFSWFYPSVDFLMKVYGNDRTSYRVYLGFGGHIGVCMQDNRKDVSSSYGGQGLIGLDYTLTRKSSAFIELGAQGSSYTVDEEDKTHVGALGKVGLRFVI